MFQPSYEITPAISKALMEIEASRQVVVELPIDVAVLASLRQTARLVATHYSTQIEGNRLTQAQVAEVLVGAHFPGRERDESEVKNYYLALEEAERLATQAGPISDAALQTLHGLVLTGRKKATPYRDGQNVITDAATRRVVYMPPEAKDVALLMSDLVAWTNDELTKQELPVPLVAAVAHYQFATIHPYYDGNGRTARLLTTLVLHKTGYGLKGIYSLEEYYARNLGAYYAALDVGPSHNYYLGRAEADITGFISYFCAGMAESFRAVRTEAQRASRRGAKDASTSLRDLDPRKRRLLELFRAQAVATVKDIAAHLGLSPRTVTALCQSWVREGFLIAHDPSRKARSYRLAPPYERLVGE